ncbi:hypothetical protein [Lentzea nigeriaca]|uniref:hypothetical protein n=1 Tax=Lentzea nigeriaca TaxID=1128665 RepID=UPI00195D5925|nr:hypothetical protein [Lentzea nigeriaca]MBM7857771.1 hypothetical protein [Lentzea nigeriaca]
MQLLTDVLQLVEAARIEAMVDAAARGWGLRRIGRQCGLSDEQVRRLLADMPSRRRTRPIDAKRGKEQAICRECAGVARRFCTRCGTEKGPRTGDS